jgi:hypothetical protein
MITPATIDTRPSSPIQPRSFVASIASTMSPIPTRMSQNENAISRTALAP